MILKKLRDYLDAHRVKYVFIHHSPAFTAQEVAASVHVPGREMIKTVMVKIDERMTMIAVPASSHVDLNRLRELLNVNKIELAGEGEFRDLFPDCEVGAMPPFGSLFGVDMIVSKALTRDERVAFNAGTHREVVRMDYHDFARLVDARVMDI
jgi:Ala-tRNA(Pro) deacylase